MQSWPKAHRSQQRTEDSLLPMDCGVPSLPNFIFLVPGGLKNIQHLHQLLTLRVSKATSPLGMGLRRILESRLPHPAYGDKARGPVCLLPHHLVPSPSLSCREPCHSTGSCPSGSGCPLMQPALHLLPYKPPVNVCSVPLHIHQASKWDISKHEDSS